MLPGPRVWREAEGRLRKAFPFHSQPPKRFSHLIDFIGFYFSSPSIHMWGRAGLCEARPGGPACAWCAARASRTHSREAEVAFA